MGHLANASSSNPERRRLYALTEQLQSIGAKIQDINSLREVFKLVQFFDLYNMGPARIDDAFEVLFSLGLVPDVQATGRVLSAKVESLKARRSEIRNNFPDIALCYINMIYTKYKHVQDELRELGRSDPTREQVWMM